MQGGLGAPSGHGGRRCGGHAGAHGHRHARVRAIGGSQASGPASAGGRELPSPSPRRRGEAGGGALPEPHGGLEEEPLPRQQLRASFTPENRVRALPPQPHGSGHDPGPPAPQGPLGARPGPAVSVEPRPTHSSSGCIHQRPFTRTLLPPCSKERDGDVAPPKHPGLGHCWAGGSWGQAEPLPRPAHGSGQAAHTPALPAEPR